MSSTTRPQRAQRDLVAFMQHEEGYEQSNPIHSVAGGREYGFRDALVPGVTVYGWAVPVVMDVLGDKWVDHGWAEIRLLKPTYPGDPVTAVAERTASATPTTASHAGTGPTSDATPATDRTATATCSITVTGAEGDLRLTGTAGLGDAAFLPDLARPERTAAEPRPEGDLPALTLANAPVGEDIRPMAVNVTADLARAASAERLAADSPLFVGATPRIHPAAYVNLTRLIKHSYAFAPSIHTHSLIQYLRPAHAGQTITLAARCTNAYEKRGHHYIAVDGVMLSEAGEELTRVRHTVIFHVAKRDPSVV